MQLLQEIAFYIGLISSIIGILTAIYYGWKTLAPPKRIGWKTTSKIVSKIVDELIRDSFIPSLIFGIGRGGAVMGSLISGELGHKPLCVIDRIYEWDGGRRTDDMLFRVNFPKKLLEKVLLVSGEVNTGNTMRMYYDYFEEKGAQEIRRATLVLCDNSTEPIEYGGIRVKGEPMLPWMISDKYVRQDKRSCQPSSATSSTP